MFFDMSLDMLAVALPLENRFARVNAAWTHMLGWSAEELTTRPWLDFIHPDDRAATIATAGMLVEGRDVQIFINRYRAKDGSYHWLEWRAAAGADRTHFYAVARDVTEQVRAKAALERVHEELAAANAGLEVREAAAVRRAESSEVQFRELIDNLPELACCGPPSTPSWDGRRCSDRACWIPSGGGAPSRPSSGARGSRPASSRSCSTFSRIATGKLLVVPQALDLTSVIRAAVDAVKPAAEAKRIVIGCHFDVSGSSVQGDPDRLQQVIWNLLSNAIKFTPERGAVSCDLTREDSRAVVRIVDTGEGIAPGFLPHAFDRFRQGDSSITRRYGGLGIGLAIAKDLVEAHGGTISAESPGVGRGATFTVKLPLNG